MIIHVVKPGETLFSIANMYGVSPWSISSRNKLVSEALVPGQTLVVLKPELLTTVRPGDTLYSIAQSNGMNVNKLIRMNPWLTRNSSLTPGAAARSQLWRRSAPACSHRVRIPLRKHAASLGDSALYQLSHAFYLRF